MGGLKLKLKAATRSLNLNAYTGAYIRFWPEHAKHDIRQTRLMP